MLEHSACIVGSSTSGVVCFGFPRTNSRTNTKHAKLTTSIHVRFQKGNSSTIKIKGIKKTLLNTKKHHRNHRFQPSSHSLFSLPVFYHSQQCHSPETKNGMCDFIKSSTSSAGQALTHNDVNLMDSSRTETDPQCVLPTGCLHKGTFSDKSAFNKGGKHLAPKLTFF